MAAAPDFRHSARREVGVMCPIVPALVDNGGKTREAGGTMRHLAQRLLPLALVSMLAPGGCKSSAATGDGAPACTWPAIYDPRVSGQCQASRAYVQCTGSDGTFEGCPSDYLTQCGSGPNMNGPVTYSDCQDQCAADEYALDCGGIGPTQADASAPASNPPAACHMVSASPGGTVLYCCPCGPGEPADAGAGSPDASDASATPVPSVAILSQLGASAGAATMTCPIAMGSSWVQIGSPVTSRVLSGTMVGGHTVTASCTVHATGANTYSVQASAVLAAEGSITIASATLGGNITAAQPGVMVSFERGDTGTFAQNNCTFDFGNQPGDIATDPSMGIAAGRVWGNLVCPMIVDSQTNETCFGAAEVLFENCAE